MGQAHCLPFLAQHAALERLACRRRHSSLKLRSDELFRVPAVLHSLLEGRQVTPRRPLLACGIGVWYMDGFPSTTARNGGRGNSFMTGTFQELWLLARRRAWCQEARGGQGSRPRLRSCVAIHRKDVVLGS